MVVGLSIVGILGARKVEVKVNSIVIVNQILEMYATKGEKLKKHLQIGR